MMPHCAVSTCGNEDKKTKGTDIIYHRFPSDARLQSIWISLMGRKEKFDAETSTVCSEHFGATDYSQRRKNARLGLLTRRRGMLKEDAIPWRNMPDSAMTPDNLEIKEELVDVTSDSVLDATVKKEPPFLSEEESLPIVSMKEPPKEGEFHQVYVKNNQDLEHDFIKSEPDNDESPQNVTEIVIEVQPTAILSSLSPSGDDEREEFNTTYITKKTQEQNIDEIENLNQCSSLQEDRAENMRARSDGKPFCLYCNKAFETNESLVEHMLSHKTPFLVQMGEESSPPEMQPQQLMLPLPVMPSPPCHLCGKTFPSQFNLERHLKSHFLPKCFSCEVCQKSFKLKSDLKVHSGVHMEVKPHRCSLCPQSYARKTSLIEHMRSHTGEKPLVCNVCGKGFAHAGSFRTHLQTHAETKRFGCRFCPKRFVHKINMEFHERGHTGEKPFACEICHRNFRCKKGLGLHMQSHMTNKLHKCEVCNRGFSVRKNLKDHMMMHTGEKPYQCDICPKSFTRKTALQVHVLRHSSKKPHQCDICNKSFIILGHLYRHKIIHNKEKPHLCDLCGKSFVYKGYLNQHMKTHKKDSE